VVDWTSNSIDKYRPFSLFALQGRLTGVLIYEGIDAIFADSIELKGSIPVMKKNGVCTKKLPLGMI
jgi:hypothetical protein